MNWIDDLATPCILVDRDRLAANIDAMQVRANREQVALRPHTKTHKSIRLASLQRESGCSGLTVAKIGEAELFADAGFEDVRLAYPVVGEEKLDRVADLARRIRVSFCVDTREAAEAASRYFTDRGLTVDVLLEVDVGYGRCGVRWDAAASVSFAAHLSGLPGLRLAGILTHAGHSYNGPRDDESSEQALRRVAAEERDRMLEFAVRLHAAHVPGVDPISGQPFEISIGSTPSLRYFENATRGGFRITEIRPGNYVFHDAIQVDLGAATWEECALTVQSTVISRQRNADGSERVFLDAGKKVFTSDRVAGTGLHGVLIYNPRVMEPLPHAHLHGLSEEHGWVSVSGGSTLAVGDRVRVVPAHACVVVNMLDQFHLVSGEELLESWAIDGRGRVN
jgi:D-serine deaminase-like pyridoxal phosphate-dependent protein